jgi:Fe-S-cluster containining protein
VKSKNPFTLNGKMNTDLFELYEHTLNSLDGQVETLQDEYSPMMQCRIGCTGCCIDGFKIRLVEALYLLKGFASVSPQVAEDILKRLHDSTDENTGKCPLLINGACSLYEQRPALCRAFGLIVKLDDTMGTCELNFNNPPKGIRLKALDLKPYYDLLDELSERLWEASPMPGLSTEASPPHCSIRTFFEKFLTSASQEGLLAKRAGKQG